MNRFGVITITVAALAVFPGGVRSSVRASEPATAQQVEQQVSRLSSVRWSDRRDAVQRLIRIGPSAEFRLRRLLAGSPSPEVRIRAEAALRQIHGMRRVKPALITMELHDVSAKEALEKLAEIEGAELPADPPDLLDHCGAKMSARFDRRSYWDVLLEICRHAGLQVRCGSGGVKLGPGGDYGPQPAMASSGAFLFTARLLPWSKDPRDLGRSLRLEAYGQPRTEVLHGDWKVELTQALDQDGGSLLPVVESGINLGGAAGRPNGAAWTIPLRPAHRPDAVLKTCKGTVKLVLAEGEQTLEFPGASGDRSLAGGLPLIVSTGCMTASILRVLPEGKDYQMDVQLAVDPTQIEFDALLESMESGRLRTFDAAGRELALKNIWRDGGGPMNNVRCRWGLPEVGAPVGPPFKLLWRAPTKTVVVTVPFELHDVKMK